MVTPLYGSENFSTTLNVGGGINNSQTTSIVLTSVSGLSVNGGILGLDWASTIDTSAYEEIEYGSYTGNELTGVIRGANGTSAKQHNNGAVIAAVISKSHNDRLADKLTGRDTTAIQDPNANEILKTDYVASAFNEITVKNAATSNAPQLAATGGDTDINLKLAPKGAGVVVNDGPLNYAADAGASDTYAVTITGISAYVTGLHVRFKANTANTGAATLNVNSLGAKTIKKNKSSDLADNDILSGQIVDLIYDGTNFQMQSQLANASAALTSKTGTLTRDLSLAGGNVAYTGLGFLPTSIHFTATLSGVSLSWGYSDSAKNGVGFYYRIGAGSNITGLLSGAGANGVLYGESTANNYQFAIIASYDADGFTLTWSKINSPTGTLNVTYVAYK